MSARIRRFGRSAAAVLLAAAIFAALPAAAAETGRAPPSGSLQGWFLVAAPEMPDPRFAGTVVYMVRHDRDGAMGFIVNRVIAEDWPERILDPESAPARPSGQKIPVHYGGPVGMTQGFILHSDETAAGLSVKVSRNVWLSTSPDILRGTGQDGQSRRILFVVGYSGWGPGQLESELARKDWAVAPGDAGLLFDPAHAAKWRRAWDRRGIEL